MKKSNESPSQATTMTDIFKLPIPDTICNKFVIKRIVGKRGKRLREIEKKSGVKTIRMKRNGGEDFAHIIADIGSEKQIKLARDEITSIIEKEVKQQELASEEVTVPIPDKDRGLVVGPNGGTIKEIERETGTEIHVRDCAAHISGPSEEKKEEAKMKIEAILQGKGKTAGKTKVPIPKHLMSFVGLNHCNLESIESASGASVKQIGKCDIWVGGDEENRKKAIKMIRAKAVNERQKQFRSSCEYNFIDASNVNQESDFCLKRVDCPNPSWSDGEYYKVLMDAQENSCSSDTSIIEEIHVLQDPLLKVLQEIKEEKKNGKIIAADMWCHFGHAYITGVDEGDLQHEKYTLEEVRKLIETRDDQPRLCFDPAVQDLEFKQLEESLRLSTASKPGSVDEYVRHDFQFYTPSYNQIRVKVFLDKEGNNKYLQSLANDLDVKYCQSPPVCDYQEGASAVPLPYYICRPLQTKVKVNILLPVCGLDCHLVIRTVLQRYYREAAEEQRELGTYLEHGIQITNGELRLPKEELMPENFDLDYWRKSTRRTYAYKSMGEGYTVMISEEEVGTINGVTSIEGQDNRKTDIHLHCDEWDRMLEGEDWEPEQIVAKLPQFLKVLRNVQSNVSVPNDGLM